MLHSNHPLYILQWQCWSRDASHTSRHHASTPNVMLISAHQNYIVKWMAPTYLACFCLFVGWVAMPCECVDLFTLVEEICICFQKYGHLTIDWPHKVHSKSSVPPKGSCVCVCVCLHCWIVINPHTLLPMSLSGYAFLLFKDEVSVHNLMLSCSREGDKFFSFVKYMSGPSIARKKVRKEERVICMWWVGHIVWVLL